MLVQRSPYNGIRRAAQDLLAEAFDRLTAANVLPRSRYEPWIHVGRHYTGDLVMALPSHPAFEAALEAAFPTLFGGPPNKKRDFASQYPYPLITAAVARLTRVGTGYRADAPEATESIEDMISILRTSAQTVTCIRVVSDLIAPEELTVGRLTVLPRAAQFVAPSIEQTIENLVPEAGFIADESRMDMFGKDRALLIVTSSARSDPGDLFKDPFLVAANNNDRVIDQFLLALRLVTNCTTPSLLAVRGSPDVVHRYQPQVDVLDATQGWVRRPATISAKDARRMLQLGRHVAIHVDPGARRVAPLSLAVDRFSRSYQSAYWWEQLVDLAIALEAAFGEATQKEDITFRLRSRAASLLASGNDSASDIYDDIGRCYELRSIVVHGVSKTTDEVRKLVSKVPATSPGLMARDKTELLIDRFRDLVRRAILVRVALSTGPDPLWPFDRSNAMDKWLTDDAARRRLNSEWRRRIRGYGFPAAIEPATPAEVL